MQIRSTMDVLIRYVLLPVVAVVTVADGTPPVQVAPKAAVVARQVSTAPTTTEKPLQGIWREMSSVSQESYLGFDTNIYPGDAAMQAWRRAGSPYHWVGYYLPAPCHHDTSWVGRRATLAQMGWGLAVLYVGQQAWTEIHDGRPRSRSRTANNRCSSRSVTTAHGAAEADDAITRTASEGFPEGTTIFLDLERMDVLPRAMRNYYRAWVTRVLVDGRYRPGIYAHTDNAKQVYSDVRAVYDALGEMTEPQFWVAGGSAHFSPSRTPEDVGHAFADVWQGKLNVVDTRHGVRLPIDISVAKVPSPSLEFAMGR